MIESESDEDDGIEYKIAFEKDGPCVPVSESFGFPSDKTLVDSSNSKPSISSNHNVSLQILVSFPVAELRMASFCN